MTEGYVLERFSEEEVKEFPNVIARAYDALAEILSSGTQAAMNKFNLSVTNKSSKEV